MGQLEIRVGECSSQVAPLRRPGGELAVLHAAVESEPFMFESARPSLGVCSEGPEHSDHVLPCECNSG